MRTLVLVALQLISSSAFSWCTDPPPPPPYDPNPPVLRTFKPYTCLPPLFGIPTGGQGFIDRLYGPVNNATHMGGACYGWWCRGDDGTWRPQTHCTLEKYRPLTILAGAIEASRSKDPLAALDQLSNEYTIVPTEAWEVHDINCLHYLARLDLQATKPQDVAVWHTPSGGSTVYTVTATGKIGLPVSPPRREPGNSVVNCVSINIVQNGIRYCARTGGPLTEAVQAIQ